MATFAEYPAPIMTSSNDENDFTLYPYQQQWNVEQQFLPTSTYAEQTYLSATTFESYPTQTSMAPLAQFGFTGVQPLERTKAQFAVRSPDYSPASLPLDYHNSSLPSDSAASVQSTISSAVGSPSLQPQSTEWHHQQGFPGIVPQADGLLPVTGFEFETIPVIDKNCVDPSLIQPFSPPQPYYTGAQFGFSPTSHANFTHMPSPAPSRTSAPSPAAVHMNASGSASPFMPAQNWKPYPQQLNRRPSISSCHSRHSSHSQSSDDSNKGLCPIATCGRHVKDLKAHMLTHQNERPQKCPILTCEYNIKGFARKYDKNRHTLTHYKGTMVCGFCPGSGSAAEKSFNRADVFKRHLTTVHGVEQTPPNARKRTPTSTTAANKRSFSASARGEVSGMCSTCGNTFANAQDFYDHLDDCVLRVVSQTDPGEAVNEKLLKGMVDDSEVQQTLEKHSLPITLDDNAATTFDDYEDADEDDEPADEDVTGPARNGKPSSKTTKRGTTSHVSSTGAICKPTAARKGLTYSRGGVALAAPLLPGKGDKRKKNYPVSWGTTPDKMKMRKRVLCVYDGQRRLWKDDMMLDAEHEVRIPLGPQVADGRAWVTDLDVMTVMRAEAVLDATEEEKGPWVQDDGEEDELERLMQ